MTDHRGYPPSVWDSYDYAEAARFARVDRDRERPEPVAKRGDRVRLTETIKNFIAGLDEGVEGVCLGSHMTCEGNIEFGPWYYGVYFPPPLAFTCSLYRGFEVVGEGEVIDEAGRWVREDSDG